MRADDDASRDVVCVARSGRDDLKGDGLTGLPPSAETNGPSWPTGAATSSPFESSLDLRTTTAISADLTPVYAPIGWLLGALGVALVALAAALLAGQVPWVALVAWVLGGPVTIGLTTVYGSVDTTRRTQPGYGTGRQTLARLLYGAALAAGLAAVLAAALHLAFWAGRGF